MGTTKSLSFQKRRNPDGGQGHRLNFHLKTLFNPALGSTMTQHAHMLEQLSISNCPRCGGTEHVRPKLLATNFLQHRHFVETFTAARLSQFHDSPHTLGDQFVSGLFCDLCDLGFIPDMIAADMGIEPCQECGGFSLSPCPFGVGYTRSDISYDDSGNAVRPFEAIIWQPSPDSMGLRVTIHAPNPTEAGRILEREHGSDVIYTLWNENDAGKPR